jgi:hypothetical protein
MLDEPRHEDRSMEAGWITSMFVAAKMVPCGVLATRLPNLSYVKAHSRLLDIFVCRPRAREAIVSPSCDAPTASNCGVP